MYACLCAHACVFGCVSPRAVCVCVCVFVCVRVRVRSVFSCSCVCVSVYSLSLGTCEICSVLIMYSR